MNLKVSRLFIHTFLLALISAGLFVACEHSTPVANDNNNQGLQPTLSSIQKEIFTPKCVSVGCHPGNGAPMSLRNGESHRNLVGANSDYTIGGQRLKRVVAGDPDQSVLYLKVVGDNRVFTRMPQGAAALSSEEVGAIRDWIEDGAQDN